MLRWLGRNLSALFLAFILALVVWISAVLSTDPNQERVYPRAIELAIVGQDAAYLQIETIPTQVHLTLNAPSSIWDQLESNPNAIRAWIDLSGLSKGEHILEVKTQISQRLVQIIKVEPAEVKIVLEPRMSQTSRVEMDITGEPALGYRKGTALSEPAQVILSGPESLVMKVVETRISLDIRGVTDSVRKSVSVVALDENGEAVEGISITPPSVTVSQPVSLQGGYRNVVVKVVTTGQIAEGYWLTNVSVSPPNVTVFSTNPSRVNELPGYVETNPMDLSGLNDDVDIRSTLNLPEGVTLAGEESVLVRLSIAALEGSLPITLPLDVIGLPPELYAEVSPASVDLLITGPLPIINNINPAGIRVTVNLAGLEPGIYQLAPVVDLLPREVSVGSILPENVEVTISTTPPPTATIGPGGQATPTPTNTP